MKRLSTKTSRGYTLMEMILVLGIIALLLGTGAYVMKGVMGSADDGRAHSDIKTIDASLIRYKINAGWYPSTQQGLEALVKRPSGNPAPKKWQQLLKNEENLTDPWGRPYQYRQPGKFNTDSYDIFSTGPDGQEGTEDDITNW